ncbi:MAG TPA: hypothetical protein VI072_13375 [Polyangiaceae bacterium]
MRSKLDRWSTVASAALVVGALLACKKKSTDATPVAVEAAAAPIAVVEPPKPAEPVKEEVKRYGADEIAETGTVKVNATAKVHREADTASEGIISLAKGTLVNRLARKDKFVLIEYPLGAGELSPGWVETRFLGATALNLKVEDVRKQDAAVTIKPKADAAAPKADASTAVTGTGGATGAGGAPAAGGAGGTPAAAGAGGTPAAAGAGGTAPVRRRIPRRIGQ